MISVDVITLPEIRKLVNKKITDIIYDVDYKIKQIWDEYNISFVAIKEDDVVDEIKMTFKIENNLYKLQFKNLSGKRPKYILSVEDMEGYKLDSYSGSLKNSKDIIKNIEKSLNESKYSYNLIKEQKTEANIIKLVTEFIKELKKQNAVDIKTVSLWYNEAGDLTTSTDLETKKDLILDEIKISFRLGEIIYKLDLRDLNNKQYYSLTILDLKGYFIDNLKGKIDNNFIKDIIKQIKLLKEKKEILNKDIYEIRENNNVNLYYRINEKYNNKKGILKEYLISEEKQAKEIIEKIKENIKINNIEEKINENKKEYKIEVILNDLNYNLTIHEREKTHIILSGEIITEKALFDILKIYK